MLARTYTATTFGLTPIKIEVEVDTTFGKPSLIIIGMPNQAVMEAKERITTALVNCGIRIKPRRTIVNLAPAELKKKSSAFDLAIAVAILKLYNLVNFSTDKVLFLGELALDGQLKPIVGVLPLVLAAESMGYSRVILPSANAPEVQTISTVVVHPLHHLQDFLNAAENGSWEDLPALTTHTFSHQPLQRASQILTHIQGQHQAKRALIIAASGGHNLLLVGPPGAGKTLLAHSLADLLPPLTQEEALEVTSIHSLRGLASKGMITTRPFRQVHHTVSKVGLIGGGSAVQPGEISLAHRGVLFLDELAEFNRDCIESLRQPLEDGVVYLSRAQGKIAFPSRFTMVAATNPCPCGYYQSTQKPCRCSLGTREQYRNKISGPILDRIDLHVIVQPVDIKSLSLTTTPDVSPNISESAVQANIISARDIQRTRYKNTVFTTNSELTTAGIKTFTSLTTESEKLLQRAAVQLHLSARSYFKIIKIARTIADLAQSPEIEQQHMAEALQFRSVSF